MKITFKNIGQFIKKHKIQSGLCAGVLVIALGVGGIGIANAVQEQKINNSKALLEMAEENGIISAEDIENAGKLADLGTEIETDEGTVVITQDESGNVVATLVKDKDGNSTGAVCPDSGNTSTVTNTGSDTPAPASHTHNWIAHYATGTRSVTTPVYHPAVTERVCISPAGTYCNQCGACVTGHQAQMEHTNATGHGGTHSQAAKYEDRVVQEAYTEYVTSQESYQYIDYYYCSECGATS